jgi:transcription elongation factor Elf1
MGLFSRKESKPKVIDLREQAAPTRFEFGLPTPCPECGGNGYLEGIDVKRRIMFQHCTVCFAKFETSEADLAAH